MDMSVHFYAYKIFGGFQLSLWAQDFYIGNEVAIQHESKMFVLEK